MKNDGTVVMGIAVVGMGLVFGGLAIFDGQKSLAGTIGPKESALTPAGQPLVVDPTPKEGPEEKSLTAEMKFAAEIKDREPQGEQNVFTVSKGELLKFYCWSRVKGAKEETTVTHVWYLNDKKIAEIPLAVKGESFRTWSAKQFTDKMIGEGRVEVLDDQGVTIGTLAYTVISGKPEELPTKPDLLSMKESRH